MLNWYLSEKLVFSSHLQVKNKLCRVVFSLVLHLFYISKNIKHKVVIYKMIKVLYKRSCNSGKWSNFIFLLFSPLGTYCKWKGTPCDILLNRVWIPLFEMNKLSLYKSGVTDSFRHLTFLLPLLFLGKIHFV